MKTLQELTLLSKFLFDEIMDIPEAHEAALRIILSDENLRLMTPAQTEKEFRTAPWLRSIRLDVFSMDDERRIYDTEMQSKERSDLLKRSRYYQGLIDSSLLEPGSVSFNALNDTYVIMITPFDLFGKGKYCYTFRSYCEEDRGILLDDGAVRIFLNTRGTNDGEVSRELADFLHYIESTDEEVAARSESENIQKIHKYVKQIKSSEKMGVKYMQTWEEKIIERELGREEGRAEGRNEGLEEGRKEGRAEGKEEGKQEGIVQGLAESVISILEDIGEVPLELRDRIYGERDAEVLKKWSKAAARAESIVEFEERIGYQG